MPSKALDRHTVESTNRMFLARIEETAHAHQMLNPGDAVLVAVSGGPDSVALLYSLSRVSPKYALTLGVAHVNHCLRMDEADHDAEFVAHLATILNLPYYYKRADTVRYQRLHKLSLEEAARDVRYDFLEDVARQNRYNKIAVAHTSDDNVESVLMYILRGTGSAGLGGIRPQRDSRCGKIKIVRPLIETTESEILNFLVKNGLNFMVDSTNADDSFLRNRIRNHLVPVLENGYNPKMTKVIRRLAAVMRAEEEWIDDLTGVLFEQVANDISAALTILSVPKLAKLHIAARRRVVRMAIKKVKGGLRKIAFCHVEAAMDLIEGCSTSGSLDLPDRIRIERNDNVLVFFKAKQALRNLPSGSQGPDLVTFHYEVPEPERILSGISASLNSNLTHRQSHEVKSIIISIEETGDQLKFCVMARQKIDAIIHFEPNIAFFDLDALKFPLVIRNFQNGDRFRPLGMNGLQKVKKYFINNKVERARRNRCPLLLSQGNLVWVAGHRMDEAYKVTPLTQTMLKVELLLA